MFQRFFIVCDFFVGFHHQPMEHIMTKNTGPYGSSEQDKFHISPHGSNPSGSSSSGAAPSPSGIRSHSGLLAPIPVPGASYQSGIPIQQNHAKSGSIITGNPLRPPPSTTYPNISASHVSILCRF